MRNLSSHLLDHLELYLMTASVGVALVLPFAIEVGTNEQELAITALAACVFQGLAFWIVRRRLRAVRRETMVELRAMLQDRINNHLTVVLMSVTERHDSRESQIERELLQAAIVAISAVAGVLEDLSVESLSSWKARYPEERAALQRLHQGARTRSSGRANSAGIGVGSETGGSAAER